MKNPLLDIKDQHQLSISQLSSLTEWTLPTVRRHLKMEEVPSLINYGARHLTRRLQSAEDNDAFEQSQISLEETTSHLDCLSDDHIIDAFGVTSVTVRNWRATPFQLKNIQRLAIAELLQEK